MVAVLSVLKAFLRSKATFRVDSGVGTLANVLASSLHVRPSTEVHEIEIKSDGARLAMSDDAAHGTLDFDAVVCATEADVAATLVKNLDSTAAGFLTSVSYTETAQLTFRVASSTASYPEGATLFPLTSVQDVASINPIYAPQRSHDTKLLHVFLSDAGSGPAKSFRTPISVPRSWIASHRFLPTPTGFRARNWSTWRGGTEHCLASTLGTPLRPKSSSRLSVAQCSSRETTLAGPMLTAPYAVVVQWRRRSVDGPWASAKPVSSRSRCVRQSGFRMRSGLRIDASSAVNGSWNLWRSGCPQTVGEDS
jgi:Flavin containing amine oxidoreductase